MALPSTHGGVVSSRDLRDPRVPFTGRQPGQGETELGAPTTLGERFWLPDSESKRRIRGYAEAERLLDPDEHHDLYRETFPGASPPPEENFIAIDFPGMLARLVRHYTFGEGFRVDAKRTGSQGEVDRIFEFSGLRSLCRQTAEALPVHGDGVWRIDVEDVPAEEVDPDGEAGGTVPQAVIRYVHPGHYFPQLNPLDGTKVEGVTLAWVLPVPEERTDVSMPMMVLREIHAVEERDDGTRVASIDYKLNAWDGTETGEELSVEEFLPEMALRAGETGIDEIAVVHMGYGKLAGKHFGRSEFKRVLRVILALENRFSQEDEALERHARPKLIVGPGVLGEEGRANLADFDVIEIDPSILEKAVKPEYLTWDMQIGGIQHQIEKLEEYLFMTTETSPASFGLERDGSQVESGRALRFKAHRTVNKVDDVRAELDDDMRKVFRIAQKLELAARAEDGLEAYERTRVTMRWPDPIIEDQTQETMDYATLKGAKLVSRQRAVRDLFDLSPEEAETEVREILQDEVDEASASVPARGGPASSPEASLEPPPEGVEPGAEPPEGVEPGPTA